MLKFAGKLMKAGLLMTGLVGLISKYENEQIQIEEYEITSKKVPKVFDGYRIAFLSDLHNHEFGKDNERLIEKINNERPDLVLVGGDMVVGKAGESTEIATHLLGKLAETFPVIAANGNHEYRMQLYPETFGTQYDDYVVQLKDMGITYLTNESVEIVKEDSHIRVVGLSIEKQYYKRGKKILMGSHYLESELGTLPKEFSILLAHNPYYTKAYLGWGADLILSGHNHGGLIRIPFLGGLVAPNISLFTRYDAGLYEEEKSKVIISRGLGTHTFKIRVNNRPELSMITLKRGKTYGA